MTKVGFIGWRGMVGQVLLQRMIAEEDFTLFEINFFSTSQPGKSVVILPNQQHLLFDAMDIEQLALCDIILTCQGSDYSQAIYPVLRQTGWQGYWIDAASALRMHKESLLTLDPVNRNHIEAALVQGCKTFVGANCTVSLMLMALGGLFEKEMIEWISTASYQAVSGAGAEAMRALLQQTQEITRCITHNIDSANNDILAVEKNITRTLNGQDWSDTPFGAPLSANLIPWIDNNMNGQSREEWKSAAETNKILNRQPASLLQIDGICTRVNTLRAHSQAYTIKLKQMVPIATIEQWLHTHNPWVNIIPNEPQSTRKLLTPLALSGSLNIAIGRLRYLNIDTAMLSAFSVGDQLLWGAAEPLRRLLRYLTTKCWPN